LIVNISHSIILDCTLCISQKFQKEIEEKESLLEKLQDSLKEAELKANELKASYENLYGMLAIHLYSWICVKEISHLDLQTSLL